MDKNEKFDSILVDGNHSREYAKQDLENAVKLVALEGYVIFDDLTEDGCNLQPVWNEFKEIHKNEFIFMESHEGKGIGVGVRL